MTEEIREETEVTKPMYDRKKKNARDTAYKKRATTLFGFRLTHSTDADIISYLESVPNKQGLIKMLLRKRMSEEGYVYTPPETEENN